MDAVGFPLFFGVVTTMVVIPNLLISKLVAARSVNVLRDVLKENRSVCAYLLYLLIDCIPAADTPSTNGSVSSHCPPLKIYFPAFKGGINNPDPTTTITRYEHLDSVLISNATGADGSRRECQFVCLYGQVIVSFTLLYSYGNLSMVFVRSERTLL